MEWQSCISVSPLQSQMCRNESGEDEEDSSTTGHDRVSVVFGAVSFGAAEAESESEGTHEHRVTQKPQQKL